VNKALKRKWVAALEGGRYAQTTGDLRNSEGYCCLGVLRQIMHKDSTLNRDGDELLCMEHSCEAGLNKRSQQALAYKNDEGWTFKKIAKWIRKHL
jgi:hypothetical protein